MEKQGHSPDVVTMMLRNRFSIIADSLDQRLAGWAKDATTITSTGQLEMATIANQAQPKLASVAAGPPPDPSVKISWNYVPETSIQNFIGFASDGSPLAKLFDSIPNDMGPIIKDKIASGIARGINPRSLANEITDIVDDFPLQRANTIARTEMIRAARETSRLAYAGNSVVTGYTRQATQDERTCLACLALSGDFYASDEVMPSHPNCRCVMIPKTKSWAEITGDPSIPDTSVSGLTSDEIIQGLSDDELRTIMGATRYRMYQAGTPIRDLVSIRQNRRWGPSTVINPLKDVA